METDEPVKSGYLLVPGQGFLKKIWNKRYYVLYNASNNGIQRLEMFDNEEASLKHSPAKIIPLTDCIKVNSALQKNQNNVFEVRTKEHLHSFSADTYQEMTDWLTSIQNVAFGTGTKPSCPSPSQTELSGTVSTHHEENLIYSSVDAPEVYAVTVIESEATVRCKLHGCYQLLLTSVGITLSDPTMQNAAKPTLMWSYRHIRRYGYSHTTFSFEAGRKASSGEGLFTFNTKDGATIFQSIATRVDSLKTFKSETELNSPSSLCEGKTFFSSSDMSNRNTLVKAGADQRYGQITPVAPVVKPPRRAKLNSERLPIPTPENSSVYENPEVMVKKKVEGDYDEPEMRQDAWKTLGKDSNDFYPCTGSDPTYEDLSYASVDAKQIVDISKVSLGSQNGKLEINSLNRVRNTARTDSGLYGKVNIKRSTTTTSESPEYQNLVLTRKGSLTPAPDIQLDGIGQSPNHIVCNDAEYAQIIRKKK